MAPTAPTPLKGQSRPAAVVSGKATPKPLSQVVQQPLAKVQAKPVIPTNPQSSNVKVEVEAHRRDALLALVMATPKGRKKVSVWSIQRSD